MADELDARTDELAGHIALKSPVAVRFAMRAVKHAASSHLDEGIEYEAELSHTSSRQRTRRRASKRFSRTATLSGGDARRTGSKTTGD